MTIAISLIAIPANGSDMQNICFRVTLDRLIKIILDIVTEGVPKIERSKKDPGFGCFVTRFVSSLIFIKKIFKNKKVRAV